LKGEKWHSAFAWDTACKSVEKKTGSSFTHLVGWTHSYVNFETAGPVEVEISRANVHSIRNAALHPARKASTCTASIVSGSHSTPREL
jgi:hypothetical protein